MSNMQIEDAVWTGDRMQWCKPQCDGSLHLQPLSLLWSRSVGVSELELSNESSRAVINALIRARFDEIPPVWSQITGQNSLGSLTITLKGHRGPWAISRIPSGCITLCLPFYFLCGYWIGWNLMRAPTEDQFKFKSSLLNVFLCFYHPALSIYSANSKQNRKLVAHTLLNRHPVWTSWMKTL